MYELYVFTDDEGNILESYGGIEGLIVEDCDFKFTVEQSMLNTVHLYKVVNGQLVLK